MLLITLSSCLKHYEPEISGSDAVKFVITGQVNRVDEIQRITLLTTSSLSKSKYLLATGCKVKRWDDKGNIYGTSDQKACRRLGNQAGFLAAQIKIFA